MTSAAPLIVALASGCRGEDLRWQDRALCAETDPEAFFPEKGGSTREAKKACRGCEVRSECLEYALEHNERFGIWGGMSERERRRLQRHDSSAPPSTHRDEQVPVVVRAPSAAGGPAEELMLAGKCRRRDLNPVEKAEAMGALLGKGYTAALIAQRAGLSSSTVSYYRALLDLDQPSQERVRAGQLSAADAIAAIREIRKRARKRNRRAGRRRGLGTRPFQQFLPAGPQAARHVRRTGAHHAAPDRQDRVRPPLAMVIGEDGQATVTALRSVS